MDVASLGDDVDAYLQSMEYLRETQLLYNCS